jgi:alpha-ketoglutaric semialdehyde dehydrogenase
VPATLSVLEPATEEVLAEVERATAADVDAAVARAKAAFPGWRAVAPGDRTKLLHRLSDTLAEHHEELALLEARNAGKPIGDARGEIGMVADTFRYYAAAPERLLGDTIPVAGGVGMTFREPLGVVALITPWNFPLAIPLWKTAPALAFGNTVVLKPAEAASHMATLLGETASAAGLPPGVFNVVLGSGALLGPVLLEADEIRAVSFTGSGRIGAAVAATAARRNIRYQTEMGGKNVAIVLADADLRQAATLTAAGAMRYAGQKCTATSRVVVAKEVEGRFLDELRQQVERLPLGPVTDAGAAIGPVISADSRDGVRRVVDEARASVVFAGRIPEGPDFDRGFFLPPVVFRDVAADSALAQEELFGPVLASFVAEDLEHAIDLANGTPYGLSASLFTRDLRSALTYVRRIEAGLVRVNGDTTGVDPHAPFGGTKGSSSGSREQGPAAREFYTEIKTVQVNP